MSTRTTADRMEESTGYLLVKLGGSAGELFERCLQPLGMRPRHVRALAYVQVRPLSQQELGQVTGMDRTTMVALVDDLERLGFARRESDENDRRKRVVTATPAGEKALVDAAKLLEAAEEELLSPLSVSERRQLNDLVGRVWDGRITGCD